jgi:hypothetical protein
MQVGAACFDRTKPIFFGLAERERARLIREARATGIAEVTGNHRLCPSPNILWLSAACLLFFC